MRHAIVGAGFGADVHLPAFASVPNVAVVALADNGSGRLEKLNLAGVARYSNWRSMLDEVRPDSLSIAVPPCAQQPIVEVALRRHIHVYCEKPFGLDESSARAMSELASAMGVSTTVGLQYRFEPGIPTLRKQIEIGRIGGIRRIDIAWITAGRAQPQRPWTWQHDAVSGGGVLKAFMPHVVDLVLLLSGDAIVSVSASTKILIPQRVDSTGATRQVTAEDSVDVRYELARGAIATARVTNCQAGGGGMRIEVFGELGVLRYEHRPPFLGDARVTLATFGREAPVDVVAEAYSDMDTRVRPVHCLARQFIESCSNSMSSELPTFDYGRRIQCVLTATQRSATDGQTRAL